MKVTIASNRLSVTSNKLLVARQQIRLLAVITLLLLICISFAAYASEEKGFFNERYRGWLWFEEERQKLRQASQEVETEDATITPEEAKAEIELLAKELDDAKYVMLARPSPQNIKAYMQKEATIWKNIEVLQKAWEVASFLYPEHNDLIKEPVNVHAVKLKREIDEIEQTKLIKSFAAEFDLILFLKDHCKFCEAFEPVLQNFSQSFGFKTEAVAIDGAKSKYFVTQNLPSLATKLGISASPTLVAVRKDGKFAFELARGFLSLTELETHSARAAQYLISQDILLLTGSKKIPRSKKLNLPTSDKFKKFKR